MFRRTSKTESTTTVAPEKGPGAKGRPTPTRREAEAAARERAKSGMDKKQAQKVLRERRAESNAKIRQGMRTGEERYLPARDQGPVKRFVRNFVDARLTVVEFLLPLLIVIMVLQYSHQARLVTLGGLLMETVIVVAILDTAWMVFRLKRALRAQFPGEALPRVTSYAVMRVIQVRPLRQPKPQVKVGGQPR